MIKGNIACVVNVPVVDAVDAVDVDVVDVVVDAVVVGVKNHRICV